MSWCPASTTVCTTPSRLALHYINPVSILLQLIPLNPYVSMCNAICL